MLSPNHLFNEIMVLPPDKRNAIWRVLQCSEERVAPHPDCTLDPERSDFFCYVVDGIKYHFDYDTMLEFYLGYLDDKVNGWEATGGSIPKPVLAKERLIAAFHAVQQDMLRIGWDGDYSRDPAVLYLPCPENESFELGFVWKQHRGGLVFIASPLPLLWLGEPIIQKGDKR